MDFRIRLQAETIGCLLKQSWWGKDTVNSHKKAFPCFHYSSKLDHWASSSASSSVLSVHLNWSSSKQPFMLWPIQASAWTSWHSIPALPPWQTGASGTSAAIAGCHQVARLACCLDYWYYLHVTLTSCLTAHMLGSCMLEALLPSLL